MKKSVKKVVVISAIAVALVGAIALTVLGVIDMKNFAQPAKS